MSAPRLTPGGVAAVAAGGALGAVLRWVFLEVVPEGDGFPWGTFAVNVAGSFLLALLPAVAGVRRRVWLALLLGPGVLGGFTTLSAYADQARSLLMTGRAGLAGAYLCGTLLASLVAVAAADRLSSPAARQEFDAEEGNE